jgi:hypothetical protein
MVQEEVTMKTFIGAVIAIMLFITFLCNIYEIPFLFGYGLEGYAYVDRNEDGQFNEGEGLAGVKVNMYDEQGELVKSQLTNANGYYNIRGMDEGTYHLEFEPPAGYRQMTMDSNGKFNIDYPNTTVKNAEFALLDDTAAPPPSQPGKPQQLSGVSLKPSEATVVTSNFPDENYADWDTIWLDADSEVYLRFLLDDLPANIDVAEAILSLAITETSTAGGQTVSITEPNPAQSWSESSLTWNNKPSPDPNAPVFHSQMQSYAGAGSLDQFDLGPLVGYALANNPQPKSIDFMLSFAGTADLSQEWFTHPSDREPILRLSYPEHP